MFLFETHIIRICIASWFHGSCLHCLCSGFDEVVSCSRSYQKWIGLGRREGVRVITEERWGIEVCGSNCSELHLTVYLIEIRPFPMSDRVSPFSISVALAFQNLIAYTTLCVRCFWTNYWRYKEAGQCLPLPCRSGLAHSQLPAMVTGMGGGEPAEKWFYLKWT